MITMREARQLEETFLGRMNDAQDTYEQIVDTEAWTALGYDNYADWWATRVVPIMRALSMRPTREIAAAGIAKVREEEESLPPPQRRTQRELGEMFGVGEATVGRVAGTRSTGASDDAGSDLGNPLPPHIEAEIERRTAERRRLAPVEAVAEVIDRHLPPDPDEAHREWRKRYLSALVAAHALTRPGAGEVSLRADDQIVAELARYADDLMAFVQHVIAQRKSNVVSLRRVQ